MSSRCVNCEEVFGECTCGIIKRPEIKPMSKVEMGRKIMTQMDLITHLNKRIEGLREGVEMFRVGEHDCVPDYISIRHCPHCCENEMVDEILQADDQMKKEFEGEL